MDFGESKKEQQIKTLFKRIRLGLQQGLLVSLLVCQVPGPYRRPEFLLLRLSLQVSFFHIRDALSFDRPARFAGENDFKDSVSQPWSGLPRAGVHVFKGPLFESGSGLHRACETVLKGSLSESGRAGEPMLKRLVSEFGSRLTRAGEPVLKGSVSESGSRVTRAGITALKGAVEAGRCVRATASESEGIIGLRHVSKSEFDSSFVQSINSSMGVGWCFACCCCLHTLFLHLTCTFVPCFRCTCVCLTLALQFVVGHG